MTSQLLDRPSSDDQFDHYSQTLDSNAVWPPERDEFAAEALRTARYELDLPPDLRRRRVYERLRAWLDLSPEEASQAVGACDAAYRELDLTERLDLIDTEHDAVLHGFTADDACRIATIVPWLGDCDPRSGFGAARLPRPAMPPFLSAQRLSLVS